MLHYLGLNLVPIYYGKNTRSLPETLRTQTNLSLLEIIHSMKLTLEFFSSRGIISAFRCQIR